MIHRDYLKAHFEEFGRIMGKIIARFLGMKDNFAAVEAVESANAQIKTELGIDVSEYLFLEENAFEKLFENSELQPFHFEHLIEYHVILGEALKDHDKTLSSDHLKKALLFYQLMEKKHGVYSFDRLQKEKKIKDLLE